MKTHFESTVLPGVILFGKACVLGALEARAWVSVQQSRALALPFPGHSITISTCQLPTSKQEAEMENQLKSTIGIDWIVAPSPSKSAKENSCSYHGVTGFPSLFIPPPGVHPNGKLKCDMVSQKEKDQEWGSVL